MDFFQFLSLQVQNCTEQSGQLDMAKFRRWLTVHSPRMFAGLVHWLHKILSPRLTEAVYHLPVVKCEEERSLDLNVRMWMLSSVLPPTFFGGTQTQVGYLRTEPGGLSEWKSFFFVLG